MGAAVAVQQLELINNPLRLLSTYRRLPLGGSHEWDMLVETLSCPPSMPHSTLSGLASSIHAALCSPLNWPAPELLAYAAELDVVLVEDAGPCGAYYLDGVVYFERRCRGKRSFPKYHEVCEGILAAGDWHHNHSDVQTMTYYLAMPDESIAPLVRRDGRECRYEAERLVALRHRFAPSWAVQTRFMFWDQRGSGL